MSAPLLQTSCRLRATPYTSRVEALGVSGFSIVNHTVLPKGFGQTEQEDYWHLKEHVQLWDVGCQRQVQLKGRDAAKLAQLMTPRDLGSAVPGQCLYAPMVDDNGGMLNDPVILKLDEDNYWFSISDSDMLHWAKGLAVGMQLEVDIDEPDVWPLAVQGPKAVPLVERVFGPAVRDIPFFGFTRLDFAGKPLIVARSGFSRQGGFEIYLDSAAMGESLWDACWQAGDGLELRPGYPNLIERIEGGLLSYGNEMTRSNNPFECGLGKYCRVDGGVEYIGLAAMQRFSKQGPSQQVRGFIFGDHACPPCARPWPVTVNGRQVGKITSSIWSPRFEANVGLGMIDREYWDAAHKVEVHATGELIYKGRVSELPMT